MRIFITIGAALVLAVWAVLFLSTSGLLIYSAVVTKPGHGQESLVCTYFTGVSTVDVSYWYSHGIGFGRSLCPRLHSFH